ncbi:WD40/YVTN/BNR-like repeat-containing protein [Aestuariirhabdus litorea]|uniref:WD40/YVTN/BNR-like repeat-containing protein n=1 Tax=Aestuariirhabdus litorea TaxID=2528527 RepID=UPI0013E3B039|nr:YCF48-related protein [Aestuariirhabdus litorea]
MKSACARQLRRLHRPAQVAVFALLLSVQAQAFEDPLHAPAIQVPVAAQSLLLDVALTGSRIVAVGERGHILYSDDLGQSWTQAEVPVRVMLTAVTFPDAGPLGWAVGHQGVILMSQDGGLTWSKQLDGNQAHQLMVDAFTTAAEARIEALELAAESEREPLEMELESLEFMLDDSASFVEEGPVRPFVDLWFKNPSEGFAVGTFGLILRTRDGGKSWYSPAPSLKNPDARHYNAMAGDENALFIAGEGGHIQRSTDGGETWELLDSPYEGSFFDVVVDKERVLLLGLRGNAFLSEDNGETWAPVETGTNLNLSKAVLLEDGRFLMSQYAPQLLISNPDSTAFKRLPWSSTGAISSFLILQQGPMITVGTNGVTAHSAQSFSVEVN